MIFKTRYNPHEARKFSFECRGESLTQQQFKKECDVNQILNKYKKTGMITHINKHQGNFGDFSNVDDYQTSLHKVMTAQASFMQMPSELRNKFNNDPAQLISFMTDDKNKEDCIKFGLIKKPEIDKTQIAMEKALENNDKKRQPKKVE